MHTRRIVATAATFVLAAAGLLAVETPGAAGTPTSTTPAARAPIEISVLSQNIMYGGDDFDLESGEYCAETDGCPEALRRLAHIVKASGADIAGVQEPERNIERLARKLGWYSSPAAHVISRFPIIEPPRGRGLYVFVAVRPDQVVAVSNVHLISAPYGPDAVRDGATKEEVLKLERETRMRDIQPQLKVLPKLAARGFPVILTGDFNTPSQLDWTHAVSLARPDVVKYPIRWPVGRALANVGLVDSYREIHPDPVARPAFTWTPGGPEGVEGQIMDRIDWILHGGPVSTVDSMIVGEQGGPDVDLGFPAPYPTDHRGVLSTFSIEPRPPPIYASTQPRPIVAGETIRVSYHLPAGRNDRIQLVEPTRGGELRLVATVRSPGDFSTRARLRIDRSLDGKFLLVVRSDDGEIVTRQALWVYQPGEKARLSTRADSYRVGQPIKARWSKAPGMGLDWIGVIPCKRGGACHNGSYVRYSYTKTKVQGMLSIDRHFGPMEGTDPWPIPPGQYRLRLFLDDSYVAIAESPRFVVRR